VERKMKDTFSKDRDIKKRNYEGIKEKVLAGFAKSKGQDLPDLMGTALDKVQAR
jgi:hypothetical protein